MERHHFSPENPKIQTFISEQQAKIENGITIVAEPIIGFEQSPETVFSILRQAPANLLESLFAEELHRLQNSQFVELFDLESIAEIVDSRSPVIDEDEIESFYNPQERHSHDIIRKCLLMYQCEFTKIPPEFIEFVSSMLETRAQEYANKSEILKRDFDLLKQKLEPKLGKTIPLSSAEAASRLSGIQFTLFDPLISGESRPHQLTDTRQIFLPYNFTISDLAHELTHALSGKTWQEKNEINNSGEEKQELRSTRTGLLFEPDSSGVQNFTWINEAFTESITREWIGNSRTPEYATEIQLLENIINGAGSILHVREAYFENFNPNGTHRTPKIAEFFQTTNKTFGPGFLVNLSHFIEYNNAKVTGSGTRIALKKWNELGIDFPAFLKKSREN